MGYIFCFIVKIILENSDVFQVISCGMGQEYIFSTHKIQGYIALGFSLW